MAMKNVKNKYSIILLCFSVIAALSGVIQIYTRGNLYGGLLLLGFVPLALITYRIEKSNNLMALLIMSIVSLFYYVVTLTVLAQLPIIVPVVATAILLTFIFTVSFLKPAHSGT